MEAKAQSAIELLTTYSWALLIITIFVAVVVVLSVAPSGVQTLPFTCTIQPSLPCQDSVLLAAAGTTPITYYITFTNQLATPVTFPVNAFNVSTTSLGVLGSQYSNGDCYPTFALVGSPVVCKAQIAGTVQPPLGSNINTEFTLQYGVCLNQTASSCSANTYKSSGFGTQSLSPSNVVFYSITFSSNDVDNGGTNIGTNGIIFLNGVSYAPGQSALLTFAGNYALDAQAPPGFYFAFWTINSMSSTVTPINTANTALLFTSNATVTPVFVDQACYVCFRSVPLIRLICPAACPTSATMIKYPNGQSASCILGQEACT